LTDDEQTISQITENMQLSSVLQPTQLHVVPNGGVVRKGCWWQETSLLNIRVGIISVSFIIAAGVGYWYL